MDIELQFDPDTVMIQLQLAGMRARTAIGRDRNVDAQSQGLRIRDNGPPDRGHGVVYAKRRRPHNVWIGRIIRGPAHARRCEPLQSGILFHGNVDQARPERVGEREPRPARGNAHGCADTQIL